MAIQPESFLNTDLGSPQPKARWTIPTGELKEYIPSGLSLEEQNRAKDAIRAYSRRVNDIILTSRGTNTLVQVSIVPTGKIFFIDTISFTCQTPTGGISKVIIVSADDTLHPSNNFEICRAVQLVAGSTDSQNYSYVVTFPYPLKMREGWTFTITNADAMNYAFFATGYVEDTNNIQ